MLNRHQRRAFARHQKRTHKIEPHSCVLWVPEARGFLAAFTRNGFTVTDSPQLAQQFCEHLAPSAAMTMRDLFGVRCAVRRRYSDDDNRVALTPYGEQLLAEIGQH